MDLTTPAYSLTALLIAFLGGLILGRFSKGVDDPVKTAARKKRDYTDQLAVRSLVGKLSPDADRAACDYIAKGQWVHAMEVVRKDLDCDLREAKAIADILAGKALASEQG